MKNKTIILLAFLLSLFGGITNVKGQSDGSELLARMDKTLFGIKDKSAHMKIVMTNLKNGEKTIKEADFFQKDSDKKLFRYTAPESDAGIATLSLPDNSVYLYLPLFKKPKKVTNLSDKNVFNSSDFSYEDMATKPYSTKYTAQLISTTDTYYTLSLKPKYAKSKYDHIIVNLNKKYFYPETMKYYNHKGILVKVATYHFQKIAENWIADKISMKDIRKNHMTTILYSNIKINTGLNDSMFTVEALADKK